MFNPNISKASQQAAYKRQQAERMERSQDLRARLAAKAEQDPGGIWADMLAELEADLAGRIELA